MEEPTLKEETKKFNLLEWTTIIYAFLTFLAYSYFDSYYSYWGIDIYSYLDASEILLIFLTIFKTTMGFALPFTFFLIAIALVDSLNFKSKSNQNENHWSKKKVHPIITIALLSLCLLYAIYQIINFNYHIIAMVSFLSVIILYKLLNIKLNIIMQSFNWNFNIEIAKIAILVLLSIYLTGISSTYKYQKTIKLYTQTSFSFNYELTTYKSNDTLLYIGATSKYIFIRNTKDSTNLIFDKGSIKNLSLTEKRNTTK